MLKVLLYALMAWFLYNLVFRFIIPVYKTTKQMKQKFREMNDHIQEEMNKRQDFTNPSSVQEPVSKSAKGDYIDFEEVK
jgi:cell division protein FtsL